MKEHMTDVHNLVKFPTSGEMGPPDFDQGPKFPPPEGKITKSSPQKIYIPSIQSVRGKFFFTRQ